ncbi:MAG: VCBS repeat-containing protein, partial [Bdellovibrionales bacterium]|nr:VCBS repeat-containing protein [Bdellovibrionales bacterium]
SVDLNDDGAPDILAGDTNERLRILSLTPSGPQLWKTISGGAQDFRGDIQVATLGDVDGIEPAKHDFAVVDMHREQIPDNFGGVIFRFRVRVSLFAGNTRSFIDDIVLNDTYSDMIYSSLMRRGLVGIGDVNGDGRNEFALLTNDVYTDDRVYVFTLNSATNKLEILYSFDPGSNTSGYGAIMRMGDLSGDGIPDYAIGHPKADSYRGKITFHRGQNGTKFVPYQLPDDINGPLRGTATNQKFGRSFQRIKDVTHDGIDDLIVGANKDSSAGNRVFVIDMRTGTILSEVHQNLDSLGTKVSASGTPTVNPADPGALPISGNLDVNADNIPDFIAWAPDDGFLVADAHGNTLQTFTGPGFDNYGHDYTEPILGGIGAAWSTFQAYDAVMLGEEQYNGAPYNCPNPETNFYQQIAGVPGDGGPLSITFLAGCLVDGGTMGFVADGLNPVNDDLPFSRVMAGISSVALSELDETRGVPLLIDPRGLDWMRAANVTYCTDNNCIPGNGRKWFRIDQLEASSPIVNGHKDWFMQTFQNNNGPAHDQGSASPRYKIKLEVRR